MKNRTKICLGLLGVIVLAGAGFMGYQYKVGLGFCREHFYKGLHYTVLEPDGNTVFAEGMLDGMTLSEAVDNVTNKMNGYQLTIKGYDGTEDIINASDIRFGTIEDPEELLKNTLEGQNASKWYQYGLDYRNARKDTELVFHYTYDKAALDRRIDTLQVIHPDEVIESTTSSLIYNEDTLLYEYIPPKTGNEGDIDLIEPKICLAVEEMQSELLLTEDDYHQAISDQDAFLQAKEKEINTYLNASITLKDGDKSIVIDKTVIPEFLTITDDWEVTLVTKRLQSYINNTLDPLFDTVGITRTIETPSSGTITVSGGTFGKMVRTLLEVSQLTEEISSGAVVEREPLYYDNYITTEENAEVGDSYIDVDISKQMVYVVMDGEIVYETPCVTGLDTEERRTPTGVYFVIRKARNYTMVTYDAFVHYWLPINDTTGVGLHDADWRGSFGGNIYKSNGSHGCINLPPEAAEKIYELVPTGMTVIVHDEE